MLTETTRSTPLTSAADAALMFPTDYAPPASLNDLTPHSCGHWIRDGHRVLSAPVLGGLHHEYRLEPVVARQALTARYNHLRTSGVIHENALAARRSFRTVQASPFVVAETRGS
jgi:hypothetical protein